MGTCARLRWYICVEGAQSNHEHAQHDLARIAFAHSRCLGRKLRNTKIRLHRSGVASITATSHVDHHKSHIFKINV
jgi:hypothetical protein